ncbi:MAG: glutaredoxin family protein [Fervidobacterium sp.]
MTYKVFLFTHPLCPYCVKAEEVLRELNIEYEEISLKTDEGARLAEQLNIRGLPTIVIQNGRGTFFIHGYSSKLKEKILAYIY